MDYPCKVESGIQVLARLIRPPSLLFLHRHLLIDGPEPAELIEINYEESSARNHVLCEIIANAILPVQAGGKGVDVLLILTDGHFDRDLLKASLPESHADDSLSRLHLMQIYDSTGLFIAILSIENLLPVNSNISLIVLDTASAFYWSDRLRDSRISRMDTYLKKVLRHLQNATKEYKTVIVYTKPSYFTSKTAAEPPTDHINRVISLKRTDKDGAFVAEVINNRTSFTRTFTLESDQIKWNV